MQPQPPSKHSSVSPTPAPTTSPWRGLADLEPEIRDKLSRDILAFARRHLIEFIQKTQNEWLSGRSWTRGNTVFFSGELASHKEELIDSFYHRLEQDFASNEHPPTYKFSGISFAAEGSELAFLDDYQSSRRSLRHELEGMMRGHRGNEIAELLQGQGQGELFELLAQFAKQNRRFQYPNWAPWAPLHWFERLFEIAEQIFGEEDITLAIMQTYTRFAGTDAEALLQSILKILIQSGLTIQEEPQEPEPTGATNANTSPATPALTAPAVTEPVPPAAPAKPVGQPGQVAAAPGFDVPGAARHASPQDTELTRAALQEARARIPDDLPEAYRIPFILDILQIGLRHTLAGWALDPRVRLLLKELTPPLAEALVTQPDFFQAPQHPLRSWLGGMINAGLRLQPSSTDPTQQPTLRVLHALTQSVRQLRKQVLPISQENARQLLATWHQQMQLEEHRWLAHSQETQRIELMDDRLIEAQRKLVLRILQRKQTLPLAAAQQIVTAWREVTDFTQNQGTTGEPLMQQIVQSVCAKAAPQDVAAQITQLKIAVQHQGMTEHQAKILLGRLGQAHLLCLKASPDNMPFNPELTVRDPTILALADDDPDLDVNSITAETREQANAYKVGQWFELTDPERVHTKRLGLVWRGTRSRAFLLASLNGQTTRLHSLAGVAHEIQQGRMTPLPNAVQVLDELLAPPV